MKAENTTGFVIVRDGVIVEDFDAEVGGFPSRVGQPAPPLAPSHIKSLSDEDEATTTDEAPVLTARDRVSQLAARRRANHT